MGLLRLDIKYCGREILHAVADQRLLPDLTDGNGTNLIMATGRFKNPLKNSKGGIFIQFRKPKLDKLKFDLRKVVLTRSRRLSHTKRH